MTNEEALGNRKFEDAIECAIKALSEPLQPWEVLAAQTVLAHPDPHWIPVEQELPTEDDDYLCTFGAETGWFVDWCSWYKGQWVVWLNNEPNPVSNVTAWCKPIEPYKGVKE